MKINLGCGEDYRDGWINIDISRDVKADHYVDLQKERLPFQDSVVERIDAIDLIEHIPDAVGLMNECWRVLVGRGVMYIETPYGGTIDYYKDPTHVKPWVPKTFSYFADPLLNKAYGIKLWKIQDLQYNYLPMKENSNRIYVTMETVK